MLLKADHIFTNVALKHTEIVHHFYALTFCLPRFVTDIIFSAADNTATS